MRFYGIPYVDALALPLRSFWMMSNNVNRLSAEEDIRRLSITAAAGSDKGFNQAQEALQREMGDVFTRPSGTKEREGIGKLKEIAKKIGQRNV